MPAVADVQTHLDTRIHSDTHTHRQTNFAGGPSAYFLPISSQVIAVSSSDGFPFFSIVVLGMLTYYQRCFTIIKKQTGSYFGQSCLPVGSGCRMGITLDSTRKSGRKYWEEENQQNKDTWGKGFATHENPQLTERCPETVLSITEKKKPIKTIAI